MPELPEVETVVRDLRRRLVGRRFRRVAVRLPKLTNVTPRRFNQIVRRRAVTTIHRRGKVIIIELGSDWRLLIHLKMTGQLIWQKGKASLAGGHAFWPGYLTLPKQFTHLIYYFDDGSVAFHNDLRQFGWVRLLSRAEADEQLAGFRHGPEPLAQDFTPDYLWQLTRRYRQRPIKLLLMDQTLIAGIGNIYADESLFLARLKPTHRSGTVTRRQSNVLQRQIKRILALAIRTKGTTVRNFLRGDPSASLRAGRGGFEPYLKVFRRQGQRCPRGDGVIKKIRLGGRGTHFCPVCQR